MMKMERVKLGDISKLINGDRGKNYPSQADITDDGEIPFINAGHLNGGSIDFSEMNYISQDKYDKLNSGKFQKGDILYCLRGSLGKKAIVNNDINGAIASSLVIIRPDPEKVSGEYLMLALDSPAIKEQLVKANNGSSQPNLSAASVREYEVELPEFSIQKEVVEKLIKVRSIIDNRRQELQLLNDLIKARFVEMFGDPILNPNGYLKEKIEKHIDLLSGYPFKSEQYVEEGINICGGLIIMPQKIKWNECVHWSSAEGFEDYLLNENDIVMALDRPWISEGFKMAKVDAEHLPALLIQRTARIRAIDMNQEYLYNCFINGGFDKHSYVTGSLVPHISAKDIRSFEIMIPPAELQNQFADFVHQVDKSKVVVQKALDETQILFNSLMQQYFG